ncbi:4'-phosphopantetheinyl transferase superfamily protein [Chlorogloeopsis sp. ULAP01]|uniref:4'-phosphopantetheinyl transferase HetI n=1 Tax=Chlorogloeopsis sp. ULAP01 TaxID=3056483 RepID=UPI0025AB2B99|nr:4'-phosphopantetheinyl transferase HetI [Chlorogloeopsis sp. ULAP01]MDM9383163.1 4'-phosphopantetheinyl transferase superfamily protein [Chlorogloeopsis sp. ULAP01]
MTFANHEWFPAPTDLTLLPDDVHLWRIELERSQLELESLLTTLCGDEVARANRFYFQQHQERFIAGRGILRAILGRYLQIEPQAVQFDYQAQGKPLLAGKFACSGLSFNLSHSQDLALCAVTTHRPIGVDLEYIRSVSDVESLAQRFFAPREYAVVRSLPPDQKQQIFFRYWTCKEAYLKATGVGIAHLEEVEIFLTPESPAKLNTDEEWSLVELIPAPNYVAATAVAGSRFNLKCWQY